MPPPGFSWVEKPNLAALAMPQNAADLAWLRKQGVQVLVSLTEDSVPRAWVNEAGLMVVSVPVPDMEAPTERQIEHVLQTISKANGTGMGVAVHCSAGLGRTGTFLASYFVAHGYSAREAVGKVRDLRPGSIETSDQERAIEMFARSFRQGNERPMS